MSEICVAPCGQTRDRQKDRRAIQMSGANPQGATQSRLLSTWRPLRQAQCGACGLMAESALADFHELRQGF